MLVIVTLFLSTMLVFAALSVDLGHGSEEHRQAQAAADAAAVAAAYDVATTVSWSNAVADTKSYVTQNLGVPTSDWVGCSDADALSYRPDSANSDSCISADSSTAPTQVRVQVPTQSLRTAFASIIGISSLNVTGTATATISGTGPCDLCVLSPTASPALSGTGNGSIDVESGGVIVNSTGHPAASLTGNGNITATHIGGPAAPSGFTTTGNATYSPTPVDQRPVADPLASLPMCPGAGTPTCPTTDESDVRLTGNKSATIDPGIYDSISLTGNGSLTLNPGTYIITGSLSLTGNGNVTASGVTFYFACSDYPTPCTSGESGATFSLTGNGSLVVSAPSSGTYKGLSIFADRNNTADDSLTGNGSSFGGTVYMKSGALTLTGNGQTLNSRVIVNTATLTGNGSLDLDATSSANVTISSVALSG